MGEHHSAQFKARVVRAALREEKTLARLASEYGVHPTRIGTWKTTALQELPQVFERRDRAADRVAAYERQVEGLYAEIGRLTTRVAWLKKAFAGSACGLRRFCRFGFVATARVQYREHWLSVSCLVTDADTAAGSACSGGRAGCGTLSMRTR